MPCICIPKFATQLRVHRMTYEQATRACPLRCMCSCRFDLFLFSLPTQWPKAKAPHMITVLPLPLCTLHHGSAQRHVPNTQRESCLQGCPSMCLYLCDMTACVNVPYPKIMWPFGRHGACLSVLCFPPPPITIFFRNFCGFADKTNIWNRGVLEHDQLCHFFVHICWHCAQSALQFSSGVLLFRKANGAEVWKKNAVFAFVVSSAGLACMFNFLMIAGKALCVS
jgi:hypothetical protein